MSNSTSEPAGNGNTENWQPEPRGGNEKKQPKQAPLLRLSDVLKEFRADADTANTARITGQPRGALSGLGELDRELSGAFVPGVHFVHGNAGAGKTAFCLQVAAQCLCPCVFVTCEMAPVELLRRHTARVTSTYLNRLKSGEMSGADAEKLALEAIEAAPDLAFMDATRDPANVQSIVDNALIVKGAALHVLIIVDSLHSWAQGNAQGLPEYENLNDAVANLQKIAHALRAPVLVVSERNRDSMKGESDGVSSGAGTRKIEYGAETVISLERKADAVPDGAGEVDIILKLAKNRHGAAGKRISLKFNGALQGFREPNTLEKTEAAVKSNATRNGTRP